MILTCDKCFTRYVVNASVISSNGRVVKCVKCGHSWRQFPMITDEPAETTVETPPPFAATVISAIPAGSGLPVIRVARKPPTPLWLKTIPLLTLLILVMLGLVFYKETVLRTLPQLQPAYNIIGLYNTKGVAVQEIALSKEEDGIYIYGKIINNAEEMRYVPAIRITVLDSDKRPFGSYMLKIPGSRMEPAAIFPIHSKLPATIQGASYISVDIGNRLELMLR